MVRVLYVQRVSGLPASFFPCLPSITLGGAEASWDVAISICRTVRLL